MDAATTPSDRRALLVEVIVAIRDSGGAVEIEGAGETVVYEDRTIRLELDDDEASELDTLLGEYPVFKRKQPETRKAPENTVYLSAVTDPKHAADFLERLFRDVYGAPEGYELLIR